MPVVLACINLKGGVGKTAVSVNFSAYCGLLGLRTLLVDLDPQTNATFSCMSVDEWEKHAASNGTIADLLDARSHTAAEGKSKDFSTVVKKGVFENVDLVPSHVELFTIDLDLASATARETKLKRALTPVQEQYDVIVCDCPPNLTIPTQNALAFCTHYAVPISPDFLSALGVGLLLPRVTKFCTDMQVAPSLAGIVLSRVGRPAYHREQTVAALRKQFGHDVLKGELKERSAVSEAVQVHKSIYEYDQNGPAAAEFKAISADLVTRLGLKGKK